MLTKLAGFLSEGLLQSGTLQKILSEYAPSHFFRAQVFHKEVAGNTYGAPFIAAFPTSFSLPYLFGYIHFFRAFPI